MRRRRRTRRRWRFLRILVVLAVIGVIGAAALWHLSSRPPTWWSPPDATDEKTQALADRVEFGLMEQAHRIREEDEPWAVAVGDDQLNAWLAARFPAWLEHRGDLDWPEGFGTAQVHVEDDRIVVGLEVLDEANPRIATAAVKPRFVDGRIELELDGVGVGRVSIPGGTAATVLEQIDAATAERFLSDPRVMETLKIILGQAGITPEIELSDGRIVKVLDIEIVDGEIVLELATRAGHGDRPSDDDDEGLDRSESVGQ
jgi:hypothetical protein